jgi:8-oxo-dGTP diphosphatase
MQQHNRPQVGIGLLIVKGNKILLGKRKSSHGAGEYGSVGGHMEYMESFESCILRELAEEAGEDLKVKNLRFLCLDNVKQYAPKHYVDIAMVAEWKSGEAKVMEPDKLEFWDWYDIDQLPEPLFILDTYVDAYKTGNIFYDA